MHVEAACCLLLGALLSGCQSSPAWVPSELVADDDVRIEVEPRIQLLGTGLSGTAVDDEGRLWAVAERGHYLVSLDVDDAKQGERFMRVPIDGIPDGMDAESLAWLGDGRMAIGTERREDNRASDLVLEIGVGNRRATVLRRVPLPYSLWNIRARANHGIEGLCSADGSVVAAVETVIERGKDRYAPIAVGDLHGSWTAFQLRLTSRQGKISALDCRSRGNELMLVAVERHYGVTRVLRFTLPRNGSGGIREPELIVDLGKHFERLPNVEGISLHARGLLLLTDHDSPELPGTTETIRLGPYANRPGSWRWLDE